MLCLEDRRIEALQIGYDATDWNALIGFADYADAMDDWDIRLMVRDGQPIGAVYTRGPEFHLSVMPEWRGRWATRGMLKQVIPEPLAITRVSPGFAHVGVMLERLGFDRVGQFYVRDYRYGH